MPRLRMTAPHPSRPSRGTPLQARAAIRLALALALSAGLSACGQDARSVRLGDVDLTKSATVRDVRERLSPADRPAFAIYVTRHLVYGAGFCGQRLTDTEGREPATVGEAIDQTRAREVVIAAAARQERRTLTPAEQASAPPKAPPPNAAPNGRPSPPS
jgi:hypothetical protein